MLFNEKFLRISNDIEISYYEQGAGKPLVFIPGWRMCKEVFNKQIEYFSKNYRVITYDPCGQGNSSKKPEHLNYNTRGGDLYDIIQRLKLKDCIVVGWSYGCLDVYSYVRQFDIQNIIACVLVDHSPIPRIQENNLWGLDTELMCNIFQTIFYYPGQMKEVWRFHSASLSDEDLDWFTSISLKTPAYAAALLQADALSSNYRNEARLLDKKIPVLNIIQEKFKNVAFQWLEKDAPHSKKIGFGSHMMFWEEADKFNFILEKFIHSISAYGTSQKF